MFQQLGFSTSKSRKSRGIENRICCLLLFGLNACPMKWSQTTTAYNSDPFLKVRYVSTWSKMALPWQRYSLLVTGAITQYQPIGVQGQGCQTVKCALIGCQAYLYYRMPSIRMALMIQGFLQTLVVTSAFYVGMTRIADNKHHWTDVLAGFVIGIIGGIYVVSPFIPKYSLLPRL